MFDLVIRDGLVVDGSGLPGRRGDVVVHDGRIVSVGGRAGEARRVIDAAGRVVAPGFIDPHTHYDAQLCFDPYAFPAIEHGVTTVVPGNCSLSMAPLPADQRDAFGRMFRLIEEMPKEAFDSGVDWRWGESFDGWLDSLTGNIALNVAPLVGHSVLRLFVMGAEAQGRPATPEEIARMADLLRTCLDAGAVGLSTSFVDIDDTYTPVPSRWAAPEELDALAAVLGERDGVLQVVHEFFDTDLTIARVEQLADLSLRHQITTTLSPLFHNDASGDAVPRILDAVERARSRGAAVWPQVQTRPIDISFTLEQRSLMMLSMPSWWGVASLPDRTAKLEAVSGRRQKLVDEMDAMAARSAGGNGANRFVSARSPTTATTTSSAAPSATSQPSGGARRARPSSTWCSTRTSAPGSSDRRSGTTTPRSWASCWPTPSSTSGPPTVAPTSGRSPRSVTPATSSPSSSGAPGP